MYSIKNLQDKLPITIPTNYEYENLRGFCRFLPGVFGILLECFFGLGSSRNKQKSFSQRNNTHKSFSNCSGSSPKKYTVIHLTLMMAALLRRLTLFLFEGAL